MVGAVMESKYCKWQRCWHWGSIAVDTGQGHWTYRDRQHILVELYFSFVSCVTCIPIQPIIRIPLCPNIDRRIVEASYLNILGWVLLIPAPQLSSSDVIGTSDNNVSGDGDSYSSYNTSYSLRKHQQPSLFFLLCYVTSNMMATRTGRHASQIK